MNDGMSPFEREIPLTGSMGKFRAKRRKSMVDHGNPVSARSEVIRDIDSVGWQIRCDKPITAKDKDAVEFASRKENRRKNLSELSLLLHQACRNNPIDFRELENLKPFINDPDCRDLVLNRNDCIVSVKICVMLRTVSDVEVAP